MIVELLFICCFSFVKATVDTCILVSYKSLNKQINIPFIMLTQNLFRKLICIFKSLFGASAER